MSAGRRPVEFWLVVIGTIAGVVGALAAVAVFVIPAAERKDPNATPTTRAASTASTSVTDSSSGVSMTLSSAVARDGRYLVSLDPTAGTGSMEVKGNDVLLACPSGQSDDTYRELSYSLPAQYAAFTTGVTIAGQADPDQTAGIEVYIQHRVDRSDRQILVGTPFVLKQSTSAPLTRPLGDAAQISIRYFCATSTQAIMLTAPRLTR